MMNQSDIEAARNEMEVIARLRHPNILSCIDYFESPRNIVTVIPLMKSTLLDYVSREDKDLNEEEALHIFRMIARGVTHCHEKGIMHCDLKLENILVNFDEGDLTVKDLCISDFGLCAPNKERVTGRQAEGTLPYMAPEILKPGKMHDGSIDSWALGVILYELLIGKSPFRGDNDYEIAYKI